MSDIKNVLSITYFPNMFKSGQNIVGRKRLIKLLLRWKAENPSNYRPSGNKWSYNELHYILASTWLWEDQYITLFKPTLQIMFNDFCQSIVDTINGQQASQVSVRDFLNEAGTVDIKDRLNLYQFLYKFQDLSESLQEEKK